MSIAGAGTISAIHSMAAVAAGLKVTAVASRDPQRSQERAGPLDAVACTYEELPAGADAVVVATPPALHARHARPLLAADVPVLVETPLAATLAEADEIVDAEAGGATVLYGENLVFAPVVAQAVRTARAMGPLGYVEVRTLSPRPDRSGAGTAGWGGGVLFDLGVHAVALALLLAGADQPVEVTALLSPGIDRSVDDRAEVRIHFGSGLVARVEAAWREGDTVWDVQASSDSGVVRADLLPTVGLEHDGEPVAVASAPGPAGLDPHLAGLGHLALLGALASATRERSLPAGAPGAAFGRRVLDVVCGAYASAGSGGPSPLPFDGPRDRTPLELWRGPRA